ncbi:hypothetical protein AU195_06800 [Mycobacterium sp. IS-1496]|nr:hypothetical protein AU195_06800 [Mycobacterium sp. IS-1496]
MDDTRRALLLVGSVVLVIVITTLIAMAEPWKSEARKECEAAWRHNGYSDSSEGFDVFVDVCVDNLEGR